MKTIWALACLGLLCLVQDGDGRDSRCTGRGGKCQYTSSRCSEGRYEAGLCSGPSDRQCCVPTSSDGDGRDSRCTGRGGKCQYTSSRCSEGHYEAGLCSGPRDRQCCVPTSRGTCPQRQRQLACELLRASNVIPARHHPSGMEDNAYPYNNLLDMCNGKQASRSSYDCHNGCHAPGGATCLSMNLLRYLKDLKDTGYTIRINELAGACHSCKSRHYSGLAADLHRDNAQRGELYMERCKKYGGWALNEATHVHCQFYDGRHPNWL